MADSKITALTSISTSTDPANDPLVIVDVSDTSMAATGTTKKVTLNNLLACSPTATLASATITGDLTVDTSTLKVDSANNRVGVNTASPASALDVQGSSLRLQVQSSSNGAYATWKYIGKNSTGTAVNFEQGLNIAADNAFELYDNQNTQLVSRYVSGGSGYHSWFLSGTTAMTLNSTGLGIGVTPVTGYRLSVAGGAVTDGPTKTVMVVRNTNAPTAGVGSGIALSTNIGTFSANLVTIEGVKENATTDNYASALVFSTRANAADLAERLRIDSSGNVIVNTAAVATTATDGFLYIPGCAGTPTGTPTAKTGRVPLVVDTTNNKLYFYSGGAWVAAN